MSTDTFGLMEAFDFDEKRAEGGVWEPLGKSAKILVARMNNKAYRAAISKIPRSTIRALEFARSGGADMDGEALDLECEILARTILLDWEGIADKAGDPPVPYSTEAAKDRLKRFARFREFVYDLANDQDRYRANAVQADAKN